MHTTSSSFISISQARVIYCGKRGEISTNRKDNQEMGQLCLHLVQASMVYINTLMIQQVLETPDG